MDAADATALAAFWAAALGGRAVELRDGDARVDVSEEQASDSIWVNTVPEPRSEKTRVHLEIRLAEPDPAPLVNAGAKVQREPGEDRWWVLADPEGNEFCVFPPTTSENHPGPIGIVVDSHDPVAQATWWAQVLGGQAQPRDGYALLTGVRNFPWKMWIFNEVPEPKRVKNRIHWDVELLEGDINSLVKAGATLLREPDDEISWTVLADPEGNEFCAFRPSSD